MLPINTQRLNEQKLRIKQAKWKKQCYDRVLSGNEGAISCPFCLGVSVGYTQSEKRVMLIGQEARGLTCAYDTWDLPAMQNWIIAYTERQLGIGDHNDIKYNGSPFWRFARALKNNGFFPCWNNLDKVTWYANDMEYRLPCDERGYKQREILNQKIRSEILPGGQTANEEEGQTLLMAEIELTKPNVAVIAVGPNEPYLSSLAFAFGVDKSCLYDSRPTPENACRDVSALLGLPMPTYWTFHPNYLSRNGLFNDVIAQVTKE